MRDLNPFRLKLSSLEAVHRDYAPRGVRFFYVFRGLVHPMLKNVAQPSTNAERLKHVRDIALTLGTEIPWLCDTMENGIAHALGGASNAEFLINPQGHVISSRAWCDPDALRTDLERLIGPVENPTSPSELDHKLQPPRVVVRDGIEQLASAAE